MQAAICGSGLLLGWLLEKYSNFPPPVWIACFAASIIATRTRETWSVALAAPRTQFIFAHMGGMEFRFWNILALVRTAENLFADNVYFDISGTVLLAAGSPLQDEFVWTLRNVGIDRVLVGSDHPQIGLGRTVQALDKLDLTAEEKAKILSGNARRLFGRAP